MFYHVFFVSSLFHCWWGVGWGWGINNYQWVYTVGGNLKKIICVSSVGLILFWGFHVTEYNSYLQFSSVSQSHLTLRPHEPQHARPPCPSPTPGVHPNPCPLSWCCPTISSSVIPFSSCPQSFPALGSFLMSQLFTSGGQSIGSFSFNISLSNEHPGLMSFRMDWLDLTDVL